MGLADALGWNNPLTSFVGDHRNAILGLGTGIASGKTLQQGLAAGLGQAGQMTALDQQEAERRQQIAEQAQIKNQTITYLKAKRPDLAAAVEAGMPLATAWGEAMKGPTSNLTEINGQLVDKTTGKVFGDYRTPKGGADGSAETGYTPIWGSMNGQPTVALPGNDGKLYVNGQAIDPAKFTPTNPYDLNAQKSGGAAFGKATGGAQFSMPQAANELAQSTDAIKKLRTETAGEDQWFGQAGALPRGMWVQGGSEMAKFQNSANNVIDRSWLSARAALKGGGQITDYEGAKAENAVSMMKAALQSGDKASFDSAVQDYEYWINQGFAKMQQQAEAIPGYSGAPGGAAPGGGAPDPTEDILKKYGI